MNLGKIKFCQLQTPNPLSGLCAVSAPVPQYPVSCLHVETLLHFYLSANFLLVLFLNVTCLPGMYFNYFCIV